jgi:hypothetical protein
MRLAPSRVLYCSDGYSSGDVMSERLICRYCHKPIDLRWDSFIMTPEHPGTYDNRYLAAHLRCNEAQVVLETPGDASHP